MIIFLGLLLAALIAVAWLATGIRVIRQQTVAIVETMGKFSGVLHPGINFILPAPFSTVVHEADLRIIETKAQVEVKTADNMFVVLPSAMMLKVDPEKIADSYYKLGDPLEQISRWVLNSIRSVAATMKLDELYADRQKIIDEVKSHLDVKVKEFGYSIEAVLIDQPSVSPEVQKSFDRVVASLREKEAAEQEAEAQRIRIVAVARAEAEGQIERAKGLAESRKIIAESLEDNIKTLSGAGANVEASMELLLAVNRYDALREVGANGNLIVMDTQDPVTALQTRILKNQDVGTEPATAKSATAKPAKADGPGTVKF